MGSISGVTKADLIEQLSRNLRDDDTISVDWHRGVLRDETEPGPFAKMTATGVTLIIHINGGAVDYRKTHDGTTVERNLIDG